MNIGDLGVLYAIAGLVSGALIQRRTRAKGRRAVLGAALAVVLWPLWLPVALASAHARSAASEAPHGDTEVALLRAHESVRDGPLEGLLPRAAVQRILDEVRRASERHRELESLLARRDFDLDAAQGRVAELERDSASARALSSARLHLSNVRKLAALRERDQRALEELDELVRALAAQLALAKFSDASSANDAGDIVAELWARVEVLGSALDPALTDPPKPHEQLQARSDRRR